MSKIFDWIYKFILVFMLIMLITMVASVSTNVIARYFGRGFTWIEEVSSLAFVWMAFTAIIMGFRYNMHPGFEVLVERTSGINKKLLMTLINIIILVFLVYSFKGGMDYTIKSSIQKTAILSISVSWKYAAIPFSAFFMILETLRKLVLIWKKEVI
jgi:TRAP-type C4-dicarboxylate transport system permease small subunit